MMFKLLLLIGLVKVLLLTDKPVLCAGVYALCVGMMTFLGQATLASILLGGGIAWVASFAYFWLLNRFHSGIVWWLIAIPGLAISAL